MPVRPAHGQVVDRYLRSGEVAKILHVSRETVTRWSKAGRLPHHRTLGGHRIYSEAEIRALLAANTFGTREETADAG